MIDPMTAFSIISSASGAISSAIQAGKDMSSIAPKIKQMAEAEAELQFGASKKKNGFFSKFRPVDNNAIDEFFRKEEQKQAMDQLRETVMLYGRAGQWERLSAEIARHRAIHKNMLEHRAKQKQQMITMLVGGAAILGIAVMVIGLGIALRG